MPRSRPVDDAYRRERPFRHPLGWTREQVALMKHNALVRDRERAIEAVRTNGASVVVPPGWSGRERVLAPSNAHVGTAYLRLPRLQLAPMALADALEARRPLVSRGATDAEPVGTFVELHERWLAHERAVMRAWNGDVDAHQVAPGSRIEVGMPVAVVTATSGSSRARVTSTHVARVEELLGGTHVTVDHAREAAQQALLSGDEVAPLALVRGTDGVHVVRLGSSSLALGADGEPLVGSLVASGMSLDWKPATTGVVAVLGVDGVRWMA